MSRVMSSRMFLISAVTSLAFAGGFRLGQAREPAVRVTPLFSTSTTVMDEPIVYPAGTPAKLTAAIVAMQPGGETGWHTHGVPLTGIVLEGELTVDYGDKRRRTYRTGDALAEAINVPHNGSNLGTLPMRLFAVYLGAEGVPNSVPVAQEK